MRVAADTRRECSSRTASRDAGADAFSAAIASSYLACATSATASLKAAGSNIGAPTDASFNSRASANPTAVLLPGVGPRSTSFESAFVTSSTNARFPVPANRSPGPRGEKIEGGVTRHVTKGDLIIIPGRTPHWWSSLDGDLNYMIIRPDPEGRIKLK